MIDKLNNDAYKPINSTWFTLAMCRFFNIMTQKRQALATAGVSVAYGDADLTFPRLCQIFYFEVGFQYASINANCWKIIDCSDSKYS
jgi:hypothetical protein